MLRLPRRAGRYTRRWLFTGSFPFGLRGPLPVPFASMAESPRPPSPSPSETPPHRYTATLAGRIETAWQDRWEREGTFFAPNPLGDLSAGFDKVADLAKLYVLDMFPYPSGDGLHVGHPLGYIGTDVYARYKRMTGHNVVHTMGFDAFGLPAEQYAVRTGRHPRATTESNIVTMRRQLRRLGLGHDSRRSIATMDEGYYRWTQWIFLQIFNSWYDTDVDGARPIDDLVGELDAGTREPGEGTNPTGRPWSALTPTERRVVVDNHRLAFVSEAPVNWCPGLGTVLSNEEVTAEGRSERGNFPVFRRPLKQWMLRITAYAERLLRDLDVLDWPDPIKLMHRCRAAGRDPRQDRRLHRQPCDEPRHRRRDPGVRRRLRAHGLRHRGDHGGARPGRARLGGRPGGRPAHRPHGAAARRLGRGRALHRRGPRHEQRQRPGQPERTGGGRRQAHDRRLARAHPGRRRHHQLQAARLAVQPPAVLGRALPDRVRPRRRAAPRPAGVAAAGRVTGGRRLLAQDVRRGRRHVRARAAAVAGGRLGAGDAGPRRGHQDLSP